ncbi:hypothetical protein B0H63DRAFT_466272 [Podospora didyma]|uniref:Uncharacterized protein n=1 Tax=Podospora didyma TaxID=330526 RepID=A0AAE0P0A1_9PEZI|nr:hypothetical protein B0H63DRAFT_466272 [Podospora didyma]
MLKTDGNVAIHPTGAMVSVVPAGDSDLAADPPPPKSRATSASIIRQPHVKNMPSGLPKHQHAHAAKPSKMFTLSGYTILIFGVSCFTAGVSTLWWPDPTLQVLDLEPSALPAVRGNALAAIAMGIYYTLAACQQNRTFFIATVPMRLFTTSIFWSQGWAAPARWEGSAAIATALALLWEQYGHSES